MAITAGDRLSLAALALDRGARRAVSWVRLVAALAVPVRANDRLVISPQDLRTADPTVANDIYAGRFAFAGKLVTTAGRSIWEIEGPTRDWTAGLHSFGWLRHLKAADSAIARANARALVDDWMQSRRHDRVAYRVDVTSRRVMAYLTQANVLLADTDDAGFYRRFTRSLLNETRGLRLRYLMTPPGAQRLGVLVTLATASLCFERQPKLRRWVDKRLDLELGRQILPDGCHVSRNPGIALQLLLDLLPLRQAYTARGYPPPAALQPAIDRAMPMLRFFRHGDGSIALFNGMGPTPPDLLATLTAYDEARAKPTRALASGGYQRLELGNKVVVMDVGPAPALPLAAQAGAGPLSFEFSDGLHRVIVNCGLPETGRADWGQATRQTAAHSTVTLDDRSAGHVLKPGVVSRLLGPLLVSGVRVATAERRDTADRQEVSARHDGYRRRFRGLHSRTLALAHGRLEGLDRLEPVRVGGPLPDVEIVARFHVHPAVKATSVRDGAGVLLVLPNRDAWLFTAEGVKPEIEESVFLGGLEGPRRSEQIVVRVRSSQRAEIAWRFTRAERQAGKPEDGTNAPLLL